MRSTHIRGADWVIAWDLSTGRHVYRQEADVAFEDDTICHVGPGFTGQSDEVVDARGLMVMPGLVDIHAHPGHEPAYRGLREEHGVPNMYMSGLYERSQAFDTSDCELRLAAVEVAMCELLKSGVTALCDISPAYEGWTEIFEQSGMRGFLAPGYATAPRSGWRGRRLRAWRRVRSRSVASRSSVRLRARSSARAGLRHTISRSPG